MAKFIKTEHTRIDLDEIVMYEGSSIGITLYNRSGTAFFINPKRKVKKVKGEIVIVEGSGEAEIASILNDLDRYFNIK
jgi:hypothetical protein